MTIVRKGMCLVLYLSHILYALRKGARGIEKSETEEEEKDEELCCSFLERAPLQPAKAQPSTLSPPYRMRIKGYMYIR